MSGLMFVLYWVLAGYASVAYAAVTGWWKGEDQTVQDLIICMVIAPFAGALLLLFVLADIIDVLGDLFFGRVYKWFEKETILLKGRGK